MAYKIKIKTKKTGGLGGELGSNREIDVHERSKERR